MKLQLHAQALLDVEEAALWYDQQEIGLGDEFLAEIDYHLAALAVQPELWPNWPKVRSHRHSVRRCLLTRFPYGIAYQVIAGTIVVLAVAAHKRRPRYWAGRIQR